MQYQPFIERIRSVANRDIALTAAFTSILFSAWVVLLNDVINNDGILYLLQAEAFSDGNWREAVAMFKWPLYGLLIALISKITFMPAEWSAYVLNTSLLALLSYTFVRLLDELDAGRNVQVAGAIIILTFVQLNEYRDYIVRDHGYWALYLVGLWLLVKFIKTGRVSTGMASTSMFIAATLFRIEGLVIVLFTPWAALFATTRYRSRLKTFTLLLLPIVVVVLILAILIPMAGLMDYGRLNEPIKILYEAGQSITHDLQAKGQALANAILNQYSEKYGTAAVIATLALILIHKIINTTGILAFLLCVYALISSRIKDAIQHKNILFTLVLINVVILSIFLLTKFFLSGRYVMPLAVLLLLFSSYGLAAIWQWRPRWAGGSYKPIRIVLIVSFCLMLLDGLVSFGTSKTYMKEASLWIKDNIETSTPVLSNHSAVQYYSGHKISQLSVHTQFRAMIQRKDISPEFLSQYAVFVIELNRKDKTSAAWLVSQFGKPIQRFQNKKNDKVLIFNNNYNQHPSRSMITGDS